MNRFFLISVIVLWNATAAAADSISSQQASQGLYNDLVNELGTALNYKAFSPTNPLNTDGVEIDFGFTSNSQYQYKDDLRDTSADESSDSLYIPKVRIQKGLTPDLNVGAFYGTGEGNTIEEYGGELSYAIWNDRPAIPALAVRGSYAQLSSEDDIDLTAAGLEFSISKGFSALTPYGGVGAVWIDGRSSNLEYDTSTIAKYFLGLNLNFGSVNFAAEADRTGENTSATAKVGVKF